MIVIPSKSYMTSYAEAETITMLPISEAVNTHLNRYTATYSVAQKTILAKAYSDFRVAGLHTKLDSFAFAAGNLADSLLNWIPAGPVASNSGMVLTTNQGWQGDGSAKYINTGFNPSSGGPWKYALNSASLTVFAANTPLLTNTYAFGCASGSLRASIIPDGVSDNTSVRLNGSTTISTPNSGYARGPITVNRLTSTDIRLIDDGEIKSTTASVSDSIPTGNLIVGGNLSGTANYFTGCIGGWAIGGGLTRQQEVVLAGIMNWLGRVWAKP